MKNTYRFIFISGLSEIYRCDLDLYDMNHFMRHEKTMKLQQYCNSFDEDGKPTTVVKDVIVNMAHVMVIQSIVEI